ncbi:MAG: transposase [Muribaculaceae bacterium]|nr:transposase [Muribaculaceae bacterium]
MDIDNFIDYNDGIEVSAGGVLPHWHQNRRIQFVTFRLSDSLPKSKINELLEVKQRFEMAHPKPWAADVFRQYWDMIGPQEERILAAGLGSCVLRSRDVRLILSDVLHYRDGNHYTLHAYVIMPNHVHMLIQPHHDFKLNQIIKSIKGYSARSINRLLNRTGSIWMKESYDRIVRSEDDFRRCRCYIADNPKHLPPTDYTLYIAGETPAEASGGAETSTSPNAGRW